MLKKQSPGGCIEGFFWWVFPEVWMFGNIRKALYFMRFGKRYESLFRQSLDLAAVIFSLGQKQVSASFALNPVDTSAKSAVLARLD